MSRTLPDLIDKLVALDLDIANLTMCDGLPIEFNSPPFLAIGIDDWNDSRLVASAGNSSEQWAGAIGAGIDETGSITCVAWAANGESDVKKARDDAYLIHSTLRTKIIAAVAETGDVFDIHGLWNVAVGGVDELNQSQGPSGAAAYVRFQVNYQARIEEA